MSEASTSFELAAVPPEQMKRPVDAMRRMASQGAVLLLGRQVFSLVVGFGALILLTRVIGPAAYGIYAAAYGVYSFVYAVATFGIETYLITTTDEPDDALYDSAFILAMTNAVVSAGLVIGLMHLVAGWANLDALVPAGTAMLLAIPLHLSIIVPLSRLQRALAFRTVATIELTNQLIFHGTTLALAFSGFGFWAPVIGWWVSIMWTVIAFFYAEHRWHPRPRCRWDHVRRMLGFGAGVSVSTWAWQARGFITPILVGRYLGAEGVGFVALVVRLVEALSFIRVPLTRIATSYLPKIKGQKGEVTVTVQRGIQAVLVIVVPLSLAFSLTGGWVIPRVFGAKWVGITAVFPLVSMAYVVYCLVAFQVSLLIVQHRNWIVATFQLLHLAVSAAALAVLLPRFGTFGYGLAEMAAVPVYAIILWATASSLDMRRLGRTILWVGASLAAVLAPGVNLVLAAPLLVMLLLPGTFRAGLANVRLLRSTLAARHAG